MGAFALRRYLTATNPNSYSAAVSVKPTGRQLITTNSTVAAALDTIPDGNDVSFSGLATGQAEAAHAPVYVSGSVMLGPGALWNGAIGSGWNGSEPTAATRVNGKPTLVLLDAPRQQFSADLDLTFDLETPYAPGDATLEKVEVACEGSSWVEASGRSVRVFQESNGNWAFLDGYHVTLDHAAFMAQIKQQYGEVNIFARATFDNGAYETQLIGKATTIPATAGSPDTDFTILRFFPSPVEYTHLLQVRPSASVNVLDSNVYPGVYGTFTTLKDALAFAAGQAVGGIAACSATLRCKIELMEAGTYYLEETTWGSVRRMVGYTTIVNAAGVAVTLMRQTYAPGVGEGASGRWVSGIGGLRLQANASGGGSLTLDERNSSGGVSPSSGMAIWHDGITVTNSMVDTYRPPGSSQWVLYWDRVPRLTGGGNYATGVTYRYGGFPEPAGNGGRMHRNCSYYGGVTDFSKYTVVNSLIENYGDWDFFGGPCSLINITYTGAQATATVTVTGGSGSKVVTLTTAGGSVSTPTVNNTNFATVADLIAWINTPANTLGDTGWAATRNAACTADDYVTDMAPQYIRTFSATNAKNATVTLVGNVNNDDYGHQDTFPTFGGVANNRLYKNNLFVGLRYIQTGKMDGTSTDWGIVNSIIYNDNTPAVSSFDANNSSGTFMKHVVDTTPWFYTTASSDQTNRIVGCVVGYAAFNGGSNASSPLTKDAHLATNGLPGSGTGSVQGNLSTGTWITDWYPSLSTYGTAPAGDLVQSGNLIAAYTPYDLIGNTRNALTPKGAREVRMTSKTLTKSEAKALAIWTLRADTGTGVDTFTLTWRRDTGNTGDLVTLSASVNIAA